MAEKKLYPFRLTRIEDKYPWGSEEFRLADLGWRDTFVHDGWLSGNTMGDLMETYLDRVTGDHVFDAWGVQFPFQIRRINVRGKMPLRVSPDDETARDRYDHLGKEKLWYVASAGKGSRLMIGFRRDTDASELYQECLQGDPEHLLNTLEPRTGQYFYIPSGTPHCAAGPMTIVEISESSSLDFCLCDWKSLAEPDSGALPAVSSSVVRELEQAPFLSPSPRFSRTGLRSNAEEAGSASDDFAEEFDPELTIIDALDFIKYQRFPEGLLAGRGAAGECGPWSICPERVAKQREEDRPFASSGSEDAALGFETLIQLPHFTVNRVTLRQPVAIDTDRFGSCIAYTSLKGSFEIQTTPEVSPDSERLLAATEGETVLVPAECSNFILAPRTADTVLLEVMVEKLATDDYPLDAPGDGSEDLVGDGAEDSGQL